VVQGQLQQGEQLVGTPQCTPHISEDHQAGARADTVTVTVSFTCTGEAFDHDGAMALAQQLLTSQATNTPGTDYAPVGQIKTTLVSATPGNQGTVSIVVQAEGIWAYQFSVTQQQTLAQLIAGKSVQDAKNVLAVQSGVAQASIQIAGGNGQTLPTDPSLIMLVIQPVAGL
jgi:VCBS repeat-containing protein